MSQYTDYEDKNVDKAVERACAELGISRDQIRYDIISHGSSGIFGLVGAKKAVIRVYPPRQSRQSSGGETKPAAQNSGSAGQEESSASVSDLVDEAFGPSGDQDPGAEGTRQPAFQESGPELTESEQVSGQALQEPAAESLDRADVTLWIQGFLEMVVSLISPDSEMKATDDGDVIRFEIRGGDSARLIGKKGQTLDAVHYLVERGVYKQFGTSFPVEIDVEGYLEKRRSELTTLAARLAEKAAQTGKPMVINRINAQDRRVVHLSLRENKDVRTQSVGNGDLRKLLIVPKKKANASRKSKSMDQ